MVQWHMKSERKPSGGKRRTMRRCDKKLAWRGGPFTETGIADSEDEQDITTLKTKGGSTKTKTHKAFYANVFVPEQKKSIKCKILNTTENQANKQFARRNLLTKGSLIEIELEGKTQKARVSSRPGQTGTLNAVLLGAETGKTQETQEKAA